MGRGWKEFSTSFAPPQDEEEEGEGQEVAGTKTGTSVYRAWWLMMSSRATTPHYYALYNSIYTDTYMHA